MNINTEKIDGIIANRTYRELSKLSGASLSTTKQWKTGQNDWHKSKFETIEALYSNYTNGEIENLTRFIEEDLSRELEPFSVDGLFEGKVIEINIVDHPAEKIFLSKDKTFIENQNDRYVVDFMNDEIYVGVIQ
ncbi:hypothetical protein [Enterococcus dongliensis]|uniref:hypothetical protein n=1 Tax=Enterococcus dongliensis TaxID=2559925 RepID=UPI00288EEA94|nr:hypothetical protein [Enterococcus dongliensis]MDT2670009.1 hypothetical protein [Enterococcus dongliensis]